MRPSLAFALLAALSGCVESVTGSTYYDGRLWWSNVKSASDAAGGARQDLIVAVDRNGKIVGVWNASAVGTLQAIASGLSAAVVTAGGQVAGSALVRPARNTTQVEMQVQGTGGSGGSGGSNTTTANASTSGGNATGGSATGGAGGAGTATGGNVGIP